MNSELRVLTAALRRGDEAAWRDFHRTWYPRLFRWLLAVSRGDPEAAGEAAHLTFVRAVRRVPEAEHEEDLWRWLTVLARSAYLDEWRRRRSRGSLLRRWFSASPETAPPETAPVSHDPVLLLEECLAAMSGDDRLLLEEKYFNRRPVRELAASRSLSEKALESRLTRARERLREALTCRLRHAD